MCFLRIKFRSDGRCIYMVSHPTSTWSCVYAFSLISTTTQWCSFQSCIIFILHSKENRTGQAKILAQSHMTYGSSCWTLHEFLLDLRLYLGFQTFVLFSGCHNQRSEDGQVLCIKCTDWTNSSVVELISSMIQILSSILSITKRKKKLNPN